MTGNKSMLSEFEEKVGPAVSYGDGNLGQTLGYGNIEIGNVIIEKVALVSGLKHNLISVSQITDRGYHVNFMKNHCEIIDKKQERLFLPVTDMVTCMKPTCLQILMEQLLVC